MNVQKYETYKSIHESLSKSLKYGFYYEAILGTRKELTAKFYRDRLMPELILECRAWIDMRNQLWRKHPANA
mgnify:FL=1